MARKKEVFVPQAYVLKNVIDSHFHKAVFENRPKKYKFGTRNYGEIIGLRNAADGDRWDIFAPGYLEVLPVGVPYQIKDILGVYNLENGNDKIAVRLYRSGFDDEIARREIASFCRNYTAGTNVRGVWQDFDCADSKR
jgi:hypothetical protein